MVPRTAARGHSFKGAGLYYLHDKGASTSERVAFTQTRNLPTDDAEKGMKWMAFTAKNAEYLKAQSGVDKRGRKATQGAVYSFSLAWHTEQQPEEQEMTNAADSLLAQLGLADHQAVYVAHSDTDHPHIHGVVNLVHPETGRTAQTSLDHLTMSKWAEAYEREHGRVYCDARVQNNAERERLKALKQQKQGLKSEFDQASGEKRKGRSGFVKHREPTAEKAPTVLELYERSDGGQAFKAALQEQGYTLAKGDRRGFVLVDEQGNVSSLSRQLKGQRAKDIKTRLQGLKELETAKEAVQRIERDQQHQNHERPQARKEASMPPQQNQEQQATYDRDSEEVERQKALADAAMAFAQKQSQDKKKKQLSQDREDSDGGAQGEDQRSQTPTVEANDNAAKDEPLAVFVNPDVLEWWEVRSNSYRAEERSKIAANFDAAISRNKDEIAKLEKKLESRWQRKRTRQKRKDQLDMLRRQVANDERLREENYSLIERRVELRFPHPEIEARKEAERKQLLEQQLAARREASQAKQQQGRGGPALRPTPPSRQRGRG